MISLQEFTSRIKQKYPQYQQVGDSELAQRMLEKYPQYANQINPQEIQGLGQSIATRQVTSQPLGLYGAVGTGAAKGALSTAAGASSLMQKGLQAVTGIQPKLAEVTEPMTRELTTPKGLPEWGGFVLEQLAEAAIPTTKTVGAAKALTEAPKLAGMAGRLGKATRALIPAVTEAGTISTVSGIQKGELPQAGDFLSTLALGGLIRGGSKVIEGIGKGIYGTALRTTPTQKTMLKQRKIDLPKELIREIGGMKNKAKFIKSSEQQMGKYTLQRDNIIKQLQKQNPAANKINRTELFKNIQTNVNKLLKTMPMAEQTKLLKAAEAERVAAFKEIGKKTLTLSEINKWKQTFDSKVPYNKLDPINKVHAVVDKTIADNGRVVLDRFSPKITELNSKIGPLKESVRLLQKGEYSGMLTDVIAGVQAGSIKGALGNVLLKRLATAFPTLTTVGAGLSKIGTTAARPTVVRGLQSAITRF